MAGILHEPANSLGHDASSGASGDIPKDGTGQLGTRFIKAKMH